MVRVTYAVPQSASGWELSEETMPESEVHDAQVTLLEALLAHWARGQSDMHVARNRAIRWNPRAPQVGVDPDVSVLSPRPPLEELPGGGRDLRSVRTWVPGHTPPRLAIEVVSTTNPRKDYQLAPEKYASSGTEELWIFDPLLAGPSLGGGPHVLQVWRRQAESFVREYAGEGPAYSTVLGAWAVVIPSDPDAGHAGARVLRVAAHADGTGLWSTEAEAERRAREVAEARVRELEARLAAGTKNGPR